MSTTILCSNPRAQYLAHKQEIDAAIGGVLDRGIYIRGAECEAFEAEFARWQGTRHAVGVANGTDAIRLALLAAGVKPGDEVITVSHTAVATVAAIELAAGTPVLVDIEPEWYTMDPDALEGAITPRTRAVVAVHLYGNPASIERIADICRARGLTLIEDCAQAHGASHQGRKVGTFGKLACFSFYPTKNLGALGDGGMVTTDDANLADRCRLLREYGWKERFVSEIPGMNSRLDELQAAVLRVKLRYLDAGNRARQGIADAYRKHLSDLSLVLPEARSESSHVYHLYVLRSAHRDELREALRHKGIQAAIHYPLSVHLQPAYSGRLKPAPRLPETERAMREILSLPMYPELTEEEVETVASAVRRWCEQGRKRAA